MVGKCSRFSVYLSYIIFSLYGWDLSLSIWLESALYLMSAYTYITSLYGWDILFSYIVGKCSLFSVYVHIYYMYTPI